MLITHTFCKCICCGKTLEITDDDMKEAQVNCPEPCGYSNEMTDIRLYVWEELY